MVFQWFVGIALANGHTNQVVCSNESAANALIESWKKAVLEKRTFIEFDNALGTRNLFLVSSIHGMWAMNAAASDELAVEHLRARKRIESEAEFTPENDN